MWHARDSYMDTNSEIELHKNKKIWEKRTNNTKIIAHNKAQSFQI